MGFPKPKSGYRGNQGGMIAKKFRERMALGKMVDRSVPLTKTGKRLTTVAAPSTLAKFFMSSPKSVSTFTHEEDSHHDRGHRR